MLSIIEGAEGVEGAGIVDLGAGIVDLGAGIIGLEFVCFADRGII
jgi:hypothetical protein